MKVTDNENTIKEIINMYTTLDAEGKEILKNVTQLLLSGFNGTSEQLYEICTEQYNKNKVII